MFIVKLILYKIRGGGYYICDLLKLQNVKDFVAQLPVLDGIVFNAGTSKLRPVKFINEEEFKEILDVNLVSSAMILSEILKKKKLNDSSSVVFTASTA